jgi:putative flippase GtrA
MRHFELTRPIRYAIVGLANTVLYCLLLWLVLSATSLRHAVAVTFAFCVAMLFQYAANRRFTFESPRRIGPELIRYVVVAAINYVLNLGVLWLLLDVVSTSRLVAVVATGALSATCGYFLSLVWVYRGTVGAGALERARKPGESAEEASRS